MSEFATLITHMGNREKKLDDEKIENVAMDFSSFFFGGKFQDKHERVDEIHFVTFRWRSDVGITKN